MKYLQSAFFVITICFFTLNAEENVDQEVIARIKMEAFQHSHIMETVSYLTDVYSPRLTGTPNYKAAANWCIKKLSEWGIERAKLEPWGSYRDSWVLKQFNIKMGEFWAMEKFNIEMVTPQFMPIIGYPRAWTPGTNGNIKGQPIIVEIESKNDFDKYRGKLSGTIVMNGKPKKPNPSFDAYAKRLSDKKLNDQEREINIGESETYSDYLNSGKEYMKEEDEINHFFRSESIAVLLEPSTRSHGLIRITTQTYNMNTDSTFPAMVIAREHYGRILRILEKDIPVELNINIQNTSYIDSIGFNVIAEIPGTDRKLKDEVVMLGGHLDSWHSGTGATDNAANCAVIMETFRILKVLNIVPRRTIRLALWDGEEQAYFGSTGYVLKHFGNPETMELLPEHENLSAYFNLDNGCGKIRGIYLQGNEQVRPIFKEYLKPFEYLGMKTLTTQNTGGTDHIPFNWIGLPGFQFIQDPLEYGSRTHHTNMDVYESVIEDDLKLNAAIIASFVYHVAMRDEKLPRMPIPDRENTSEK